MVWFVRKPNKRAAIVAGAVVIGITALTFPAGLLRSPCRGAVGIGLAALIFPAGYFPYCASPAGGAVSMVLAALEFFTGP